MKCFATVLLLASFALTCAAQAQQAAPSANPLVAEAKGHYDRYKGNITKAAEKMPEENFTFAPTKEQMTFIKVVAHIADASTGGCAALKGEQKAGDAASATTKADVMAKLKASFEYCDGAIGALTDAAATDTTKGRSKLARLWGNNAHNMEQYAIMSMYMRLKGVMPPTAQN